MVILRLVGVLALIAVGAAFALFLFTRDRCYLAIAWRVLQFGFVFLLAVLVLFALERFMFII